MKPIEPGCLALVISYEDAGMTVECVEFKSTGFKFRSGRDGEIYKTSEPAWITNDPDGAMSIRPSRLLLRIDGGEDESVNTEQDEELMA